MGSHPQVSFEPRKTPVQARSTVTVEAIFEATIQVLLEVGPDRLTTTRVAERAGVSVGTLYQYFPNKQSLLFSVMEQHLTHVGDAMVQACQRNHGEPVATMVESVVQAFVDAKLKRSDISMALYATTTGRKATALMSKVGKRAQVACAAMLATASDAEFSDLVHDFYPFFGDGWRDSRGSRSRRIAQHGELATKAVSPAGSELPDECSRTASKSRIAFGQISGLLLNCRLS